MHVWGYGGGGEVKSFEEILDFCRQESMNIHFSLDRQQTYTFLLIKKGHKFGGFAEGDTVQCAWDKVLKDLERRNDIHPH